MDVRKNHRGFAAGCTRLSDSGKEWRNHTYLTGKVLPALGLVIGLLVSCATGKPGPQPPPNRTYTVPPAVLQQKIAAILPQPPLSLEIQAIHDGQIVTAYEQYAGEIRGLLWWKKRWQERVRYVIEVRQPAWYQPYKSQLFIRAEADHRPNSNYAWQSKRFAPLHNRVSEILGVIDSKIAR